MTEERYINGKITAGRLEGVEIRIGPLPTSDPKCDTQSVTEICRPVPLRFEGSEFENVQFELKPQR